MQEEWAFQHSLECPVPKQFAWRFWSEVSNWKLDSDIELVELNGPFAAGSHGATITRSVGRINWRLAEVKQGRSAVVEISLGGAVGRFFWTFEDLNGRTRLTQRASIDGENAAALVRAMASGLESGIPAGMERLCQSMTKAARVEENRKNKASSRQEH